MTVRILVADNSITIQKIVAMAFENEDAEVEGIGNGQKAFDRIPDFKPDIVLADVDMPGLNGFQLCKKIKGASDLKNIKVMLLASDFECFDEELFKKCRAENHISKPFKSVDIVEMVTRVMEEGDTTKYADEPALQENIAEEGPGNDNDDEPSLEELLESVKKLSIDSKNFLDTEGIIEDIEDAPLLAEFEEPEMEEQTFSEDVYAEVQPRNRGNPEDLDSVFKEIVAGDLKQQSVSSSNIKESEMSFLGGIIPEPEEPLEKVVPGAFSESERRHHLAEEIDKNQNTGSSLFESTHYQGSHLQEREYENSRGALDKVTGEQVKHILEKLLDSSMQNEMTGLSETIVKTIREVIHEITPEIVRSVIREEIEKDKKV
ncbi:response regulator [Nitrospinaceae bacterium]|nr:response regulator [Nitrospinaceae bacterium]